jgi:hypothetical protein
MCIFLNLNKTHPYIPSSEAASLALCLLSFGNQLKKNEKYFILNKSFTLNSNKKNYD